MIRQTCTFILLIWYSSAMIAQETNEKKTDRILFVHNGYWGYKNAKGDTVIPPKYKMGFNFNENGIASVIDQEIWYIIDTTGNIIVTPFVYDDGPDSFQEEMARFVENNKIGFINKKAEKVINATFDYATSFHEGLAAFCIDCSIYYVNGSYSVLGGNWGYIDQKGEIKIEPVYDGARFFKEGKASVKKDGKWIYIDNQGKLINEDEIIQPQP